MEREAPKNIPQDRGVAVQVTILDEVPHSAEGIMPGEEMAAALEQLAATNALSEISDPVQWERSIRQDRSLPGRD